MKRILILYTILALVSLIISSCNEDILETKPLTQFSDLDVWTDPALAETYVNNLYNQIMWKMDWTGMRVDEIRERAGEDDPDFNNMLITPDNVNYWWGNWDGTYRSIRACNIFLENIDNLPESSTLIDGKTVKDRMKGEVTFLRAWYYNHLVNFFGGVPLIKNSYTLTDEFSVARDSYEDCVKFIADECDIAASLLPVVNTGVNNGRVTKGAALTLKSRVLLYAASDLHNSNKFSGYSNPELLGYQGGDRTARWQAAKDAAKAVIDMNVYSLHNPEPASLSEASENYHQVFNLPQTNEDIFVRFFSATANKGFGMFEVYPNGWYGNGRGGAINELADAYEMVDGTKFSRENPEQNLNPYQNRDPRFYATVIYEGAIVAPRTSDMQSLDPIGVMQAGRWEVWNSQTNSVDEVWGLDTRNSPVNSWNSSLTATGCKKYLNTTFPASTVWQNSADITWRYMRYGEIILNYVEACIELGEEAEARTFLNMIRKRAGMPDISDSGEALKERYRNERRVELALEDHRFFDVRRWLIAPEAYHAVHGVDIVYKLNSDNTTASIPTITPVEIMTGSWDDKAYFMPFTRDEVNKNTLLVQNPGYN